MLPREILGLEVSSCVPFFCRVFTLRKWPLHILFHPPSPWKPRSQPPPPTAPSNSHDHNEAEGNESCNAKAQECSLGEGRGTLLTYRRMSHVCHHHVCDLTHNGGHLGLQFLLHTMAKILSYSRLENVTASRAGCQALTSVPLHPHWVHILLDFAPTTEPSQALLRSA